MTLPHARKTWRKQKHQRYNILPWIRDPTTGIKTETKGEMRDPKRMVFGQRKEAIPMELFFDLFFVANLALFTQYHIIIEHEGFLSYVEFFSILWGAWFSITLFDVRFALDSIYERACKVVQCSVFVVFSLVGSDFLPGSRTLNPEASDRENSLRNFRILSYALATSRALLTIQYAVTTYFCARRNLKNLILPLCINTGVYALASISFGLLSLAFHTSSSYHPNIYLVWYVTMGVEMTGVMIISSIWRQLSFKLTHLVERMGLLTLIIIGEGIIGVTKTITILLKNSELVDYYALVFCILLVIFWLYMCYFDTQPHGHFGTQRQQWWAFLHYPLHLSILGILEGAQQLVREQYVLNNFMKWAYTVNTSCATDHETGDKLVSSLNKTITSYKILDKAITNQFRFALSDQLVAVGDTPNICSPANISAIGWNPSDEYTWDINALPYPLNNLTSTVLATTYSASLTDQQLPIDEVTNSTSSSPDMWATAYYYFWGGLALFCFITIIMGILSRKSRIDLYSALNIASRVAVMAIAMALGILGRTNLVFYNNFSSSVAIVPVAMSLLFAICVADRAGKFLSNWRLGKREGEADILYEEAEGEDSD